MALIKPLPTQLVHLIAAGEVIDSLAAVVRELVENAIDAQATRISLAIKTENLANLSVQITDNGIGIDLANLRQAAAPHTTSKIARAADLQAIESLGFRGEALHSLAQLAELQICSRTETADAGWQVTYDRNGQVIDAPKTVAIAPGTIVQAQQIFKFYPARLEALPSISQQLRQVQLIIQLAAIAHPYITWQASLNQKNWFNIWSGKYTHDILPQIVRSLQPQNLVTGIISGAAVLNEIAPNNIDIKGDRDDLAEQQQITENQKFTYAKAEQHQKQSELEHLKNKQTDRLEPEIAITLGLPDRASRHRLDWVKVALNGRMIDCPEISQTIIAAFARTLPRHRYPICVVHLQLPPEQIDWNRSIAKTEVYIRQIEHYQAKISDLIGEILRQPQRFILPRPIEVNPLQDAAAGLLRENSIGYNPKSDNQTNPIAENTPLAQGVKVVAQVQNTYILVEHDRGLWLIEQHVAHERVLFEQLQQQWQVVALEQPIVLANLTRLQIERLQEIPLQVETFGDGLMAVRSLPQILLEQKDRKEILIELSHQKDLPQAMATLACRSAVRNGTKLEMRRSQEIFRQWQRTRNPHTCPHGRPICLSLDANDLARYFKRNWIVGKG
ncbi:DNA mismatch repair protein MutL [Thalassoporum mexicanum PCC 7367]|uniref:DNA mismatch repair endonuclease MutL n=1 Tax=Thalassoporum mexicanum TaxID=3457544 RepID=UPI00029FCE61|nr:DNA mismatch repair endonuclease MutL [Pseudanabaena sp. PCC 7367]AFY71187.1 DNA mismatch repair protein MutL [Pseudanabaena sp. PCC 7367]